MAYLEFPKALYINGDTTKACKVVQTADQEAAAALEGYEALPANPPADPAQPGSPEHLPFPAILYRRGDDGLSDLAGETTRVESLKEQEAAAAEGFFPLKTQPDEAGDESEDAPSRRSRKKK